MHAKVCDPLLSFQIRIRPKRVLPATASVLNGHGEPRGPVLEVFVLVSFDDASAAKRHQAESRDAQSRRVGPVSVQVSEQRGKWQLSHEHRELWAAAYCFRGIVFVGAPENFSFV